MTQGWSTPFSWQGQKWSPMHSTGGNLQQIIRIDNRFIVWKQLPLGGFLPRCPGTMNVCIGSLSSNEKLLGQSKPNFIWILLGNGRHEFIRIILVRFRTTDLSKEECQTAFVKFAKDHLCYGTKPAKEMQITKTLTIIALHVSILSFVR